MQEQASKEGAALNVRTDASMQLLATCMDAVVDLHSSDDPALLQSFVKLGVGSKMTEAFASLESKMGERASAGKQSLDDASAQQVVEMCLGNTHDFLEYKKQFC